MSWNDLRLPVCWAAAVTLILWGLLRFPMLVSARTDDVLIYYCLNAVQQALVFGLPALLVLLARPGRWQTFRSSLRPVPLRALGGFALLAAGGTVTLAVIASLWSSLLQAWGYVPEANPLPNPETLGQWLLCLAAVALIPAACEELLFRALLQGTLRRYLPRAGVWIAAVAFAALHFRWEAFPALLLIGLTLGHVFIRYGYGGSLALHALYNTATLALSAAQPAVTLALLAACCFLCFAALRLLFGKELKDETDRSGL